MVRTGILAIPSTPDGASCQDTVAAVVALLQEQLDGCTVVRESVVADQRYLVEEVLRRWCDQEEMDLVITVGGTSPAPGPSSRQSVPEATGAVLERPLPGLPEAMRAWAAEQDPLALLDRGMAGIRGRTLLLNLPEAEELAVHFLEAIVDLLPAVLACLAPEPETAVPSTPRRRGLDPEEFAAHLRRKATGTGQRL